MTTLRCEACDRNFGSDEALMQHNEAKHSNTPAGEKAIEKHEAELAGEGPAFSFKAPKLAVKHALYGIGGILAILVVYTFVFAPPVPAQNSSWYTQQGVGVHWHARLDMEVCGNEVEFPYAPSGTQGVHDGMHSHNDGIIHMEFSRGVKKAEDVSIGAYFRTLKYNLTEYSFQDPESRKTWVNGDQCPDGRKGKVTITVNGEPATPEYVLGNFTEGDGLKQRVRIMFGPEGSA
jgi:hypothetical protein